MCISTLGYINFLCKSITCTAEAESTSLSRDDSGLCVLMRPKLFLAPSGRDRAAFALLHDTGQHSSSKSQMGASAEDPAVEAQHPILASKRTKLCHIPDMKPLFLRKVFNLRPTFSKATHLPPAQRILFAAGTHMPVMALTRLVFSPGSLSVFFHFKAGKKNF